MTLPFLEESAGFIRGLAGSEIITVAVSNINPGYPLPRYIVYLIPSPEALYVIFTSGIPYTRYC
jgi:hypothetical protein